jgi:hypothetical protein
LPHEVFVSSRVELLRSFYRLRAVDAPEVAGAGKGFGFGEELSGDERFSGFLRAAYWLFLPQRTAVRESNQTALAVPARKFKLL